MTVAELGFRMSAAEFSEWVALEQVREEEERAREARQEARRG